MEEKEEVQKPEQEKPKKPEPPKEPEPPAETLDDGGNPPNPGPKPPGQ
jgi:hypothetical protein